MHYQHTFIDERSIPRSVSPILQHLLDTYVSETNKTASVWSEIPDTALEFRPHPRSMTFRELLSHQLLSERRFFADFIGLDEPAAVTVLPSGESPGVAAYRSRYLELALPRFAALAGHDQPWWLEEVPFFDARRQRIWVFWRRVLHTAHHRAQAGVMLRLNEVKVPPTYGPTADVTWAGATPTRTATSPRPAA